MEIVLYYAPITCALVPYITLTEAKADFEVLSLDFKREQHKSPDYLKINPKHKVPLLIVDGKKLTENVAIHQWINRTFPQAKLLPSDPWQELQAISMHSWCSGGIHPFLTRINSPPKICAVPGTEDSVRKLATENLHENFKIADEMLGGREYFFDHFTSPDAHFFWCFRRAGQLVSISPRIKTVLPISSVRKIERVFKSCLPSKRLFRKTSRKLLSRKRRANSDCKVGL